MRQVESSDPESVRLAELIDAGRAAKMLGLHMPDGHGAGRIWLVGVSEFVLESFETQSVAVVIDGPPQRFRRRQVAPVSRLTDREVGCDHATLILDADGVSNLVHQLRTRQLRVGRSVPVPMSSRVWF